ncbi:hypothetical protein [Streptomyces rubradiris]|nr:hypothetical protein [Streptomyces rubradiris]
MAALGQRIALRYALPPMTAEETAGYLAHHITLAGRSDTMFCDDATSLTHTTSRGLPRADIRRCGECGGETPPEILVTAAPSQITHPGAISPRPSTPPTERASRTARRPPRARPPRHPERPRKSSTCCEVAPFTVNFATS